MFPCLALVLVLVIVLSSPVVPCSSPAHPHCHLCLSLSSHCPHCCPLLVPPHCLPVVFIVVLCSSSSNPRPSLVLVVVTSFFLILLTVAPMVHPASSCSQWWVWVLGHPSSASFCPHAFIVLWSLLSCCHWPCEQVLTVVGWVGFSISPSFFVVSSLFHCCSCLVSCTCSQPTSRCLWQWFWVLLGWLWCHR